MRLGISWVLVAASLLFIASAAVEAAAARNAYASMMYMGTPRDYEFYVATRVMMRSLRQLGVDADLVVIASDDVPRRWVQTLKTEDGVKVVTVKNLRNPYENQGNFNSRFKLTLNKLYAWSLIDYDRVIMLDSDNLFLQKTDELFQCGQFCAVFINPCIFHTGLFVLQPSMEVFNDMLHELDVGRSNPDGADQGFLASYFPDLLDQPMFHPPPNGSKVDGSYRLPLGYQMDASYFYLKLRWSIPCGPNSVVTFPSAPWFKPWYWWSWPVLPLGLSWHGARLQTIGYGSELPVMVMQSLMYIAIIIMTRIARPSLLKLLYNRRSEKNVLLINMVLKVGALWSILTALAIPFLLVPRTIHPLLGWPLYLLGSASLCLVVSNAFLLPTLSVFTPWIAIFVALFVLACPWYSNGIVRAILVSVYACFCTPFLWTSYTKISASLHLLIEREVLYPRLGEATQTPEFNKLF